MSDVSQTFTGKELKRERLRNALASSMPPEIDALLHDKKVNSISLDQDYHVVFKRFGERWKRTEVRLEADQIEGYIRLTSSLSGQPIDAQHPQASVTMPGADHRVTVVYPPYVARPTVTWRRLSATRRKLSKYLRSGSMTAAQLALIEQAILQKLNIVIVGGAGSGKTTLLDSLIGHQAFSKDRLVIIEDTTELTPPTANCVSLLTRKIPPVFSADDAVATALRLDVDRILIGELRTGEAALSFLKALNTGHAGGCCTIHAHHPVGALHRFEELISELYTFNATPLIARTINVVIHVAAPPPEHLTRARPMLVANVALLEGADPKGRYVFKHHLHPLLGGND